MQVRCFDHNGNEVRFCRPAPLRRRAVADGPEAAAMAAAILRDRRPRSRGRGRDDRRYPQPLD